MDKSFLAEEDSEPPSSRSWTQSALALEHAQHITLNSKNVSNLHSAVSYADIVRPFPRKSIRFPINQKTDSFRKRVFPGITVDKWNDWRWQLRNRIRTLDKLESMFNLTEDERVAVLQQRGSLHLAITPYYASLIDPDDPSSSLRRCMVPVTDEYLVTSGEAADPLGEDADSPVPGIVHRYPDRALFLVTNVCAANCRYCTRSRYVDSEERVGNLLLRWEKAIDYIRSTPAIRDVLISGGDPLTMSDDKIAWLLTRLRAIEHVEFIRIGTKVPVVLPQRITPELTAILRRFHPLWMSIHCTHPDELTPETVKACTRLADAGIPLGSQTVLLAGINDNVDTMRSLMHGLLKVRVRPYYLYQCDPIQGSSHFRTPVRKGLEIIRGLRGFTTGYGIPTYVIDAPGGGGKIPLLPEYFVGTEGSDILLRSYDGNIYRYPDSIGSA